MRRAGLDYMDWKLVEEHPDYASCLKMLPSERVFACSTKGTMPYTVPRYRKNDAFIFGPETRGLPDKILAGFAKENIIRVPMLQKSRSINLSNTAAIFLYEAWRQHGFAGAN